MRMRPQNFYVFAELINANEAYFELFSLRNDSKINEIAEFINANDQILSIAELNNAN